MDESSEKTRLQPCRKNVAGGRVKKALTAFVGTCGAATVMTLAIDSSVVRAQPGAPAPASEPARLLGDVAVVRISATEPATCPATKPATPTTQLIQPPGGPAVIKVETQPAK
jgi:hypothetical protein